VTFQQMQQACGAPRYPPDETDPDPVMRAAAAAAGAGGAPGGMGPDAVVRANYGAVLSGSPVAMRVLAESLAAQAAKRVAWRTSRLRLLAEANARRCSAPPPMLGPDTLALLRGAMGVHSCSRALAPERVWVRELDPASAASSADAGAAEGAAGAAGGGAGAAVAAGAAGGGGTSTSSGCGPRGDPELSGMVRWRPPGADGIAGARTGARLPRAAAAVYARGALSELALEVGASYASQADAVDDMLRAFMMYIPKARAIQAPAVWCSHPDTSMGSPSFQGWDHAAGTADSPTTPQNALTTTDAHTPSELSNPGTGFADYGGPSTHESPAFITRKGKGSMIEAIKIREASAGIGQRITRFITRSMSLEQLPPSGPGVGQE
ncbi:hypothetical protein FOA52_007229, partial [Chlamydomonas sp. UWO 241]